MNKSQIGNTILVLALGLLAGAVAGNILDRFLGTSFLSNFLFENPFVLELYIIKVEIQLTPASLIGLVVTAYFALKKG